MEKKIYLFCAALAALATFNSCTSDDEIVETTIPEQPVEVKGEPISFTATINDGNSTRANVAGTLNGFTLWGVQNNAVSTPTTGLAYAYDGDLNAWVNADAPTYDTGESPVPYYFYAMALGNTPIAPDADGYDASKNAAKANAIEFFNNGRSSNTNGSVVINGDDLMLANGDYDDKSFTYTMPVVGETSQIDLSAQEDLLVAHNFGTENKGWKTGAVPLQFEHALANIELYLGMPQRKWFTDKNSYDTSYDDAEVLGIFTAIKSITIHGLKKTGTYTFGTGWSNPVDAGDIKIEYPQGLFVYGFYYDTPEDNDVKTLIAGDLTERRKYERAYYDPIITEEQSIMVIPQTFTPWTTNETIENSSSNCYIEIEAGIYYDATTAQDEIVSNEEKWTTTHKTDVERFLRSWSIFGGDDSPSDDFEENNELLVSLQTQATFAKYYLPLNINTANKLMPNKKYKLYIDLFHLFKDNGDTALDYYNPNE